MSSNQYSIVRIPSCHPERKHFAYGLCAICKNPPKDGWPLSVDHNHETNAVRQLLCDKCNKGLGLFKDNRELLEQAVAYLKRHEVISNTSLN